MRKTGSSVSLQIKLGGPKSKYRKPCILEVGKYVVELNPQKKLEGRAEQFKWPSNSLLHLLRACCMAGMSMSIGRELHSYPFDRTLSCLGVGVCFSYLTEIFSHCQEGIHYVWIKL
jgi:hypothetical protein